MEVDIEFRNVKDSSELMLNREIFQKLCSNLGNRIGLFYIERVETTQKIRILGNRPIQHGEGCISNKLVPRFELRFPPIQSNWQDPGESPEGKSSSDLGDSWLASQIMVPKVARNEHSKLYSSSKFQCY